MLSKEFLNLALINLGKLLLTVWPSFILYVQLWWVWCFNSICILEFQTKRKRSFNCIRQSRCLIYWGPFDVIVGPFSLGRQIGRARPVWASAIRSLCTAVCVHVGLWLFVFEGKSYITVISLWRKRKKKRLKFSTVGVLILERFREFNNWVTKISIFLRQLLW